MSVCWGLGTVGQLSWSPTFGGRWPKLAQYPSLSWSLSGSDGHTSHGSPVPSKSPSAWPGLVVVGQLSSAPTMGGLKLGPVQTRSLSASFTVSNGQGSHASPSESPSLFCCE